MAVHRDGAARPSAYPVFGPTGRLKNKEHLNLTCRFIHARYVIKLVKTKARLNVLQLSFSLIILPVLKKWIIEMDLMMDLDSFYVYLICYILEKVESSPSVGR